MGVSNHDGHIQSAGFEEIFQGQSLALGKAVVGGRTADFLILLGHQLKPFEGNILSCGDVLQEGNNILGFFRPAKSYEKNRVI
jgi:hypothetical protein